MRIYGSVCSTGIVSQAVRDNPFFPVGEELARGRVVRKEEEGRRSNQNGQNPLKNEQPS